MTASRSTSAVVIGASGGIGRALVCALAESDAYAPVFALSRSAPSVPRGVRTHPIELGDEPTVAAAAAKVGEAGPVGLVIVATGILHQQSVRPEKTVKALDPAAMATVFSVNTIGPALVAKHFVPLLARQGRCVFAALSARVGSIGDNRLGGWYTYRDKRPHRPPGGRFERNYLERRKSVSAAGFPRSNDVVDMARSALMSRVRGMNIKPELVVRRLAHALGHRFRLHRRDLPGSPDLVFPRRRKVLFVHGCVWHRHPGCRRASMPGTREEFWSDKFARNVERDATAEHALKETGWDVLIV